MHNESTTSEYTNITQTPVVIIDAYNENVLYANAAATALGFTEGNRYDVLRNIHSQYENDNRQFITVNGITLQVTAAENGVQYGGATARLIVFSFVKGGLDTLEDRDICDIFLKQDRARTIYDFLHLTGKHAGAFCAALYETHALRYVLRGEWRSRRCASIPALPDDIAQQAENGYTLLKTAKGAADAAVFPYTKQHGAKGYAIYFFDSSVDKNKRERLERFVALYGILANDSPNTSRLVLLHGVNALEQGLAIWRKNSRELLYCNRVYRGMFGSDSRQFNSELGKNIRGNVTHETITNGQGRYCDVTHTVCGNRGEGVISTIIIDNTAYVKAQRRLDAMANTDALTGLFNRRAGLEYLRRMYSQCRRQGKPITVCFADIDGLKRINDTWGHEAGDEMIQAAAALIQKSIGDKGEACRLGGDEFILILPGQTEEAAVLLATQISREAERILSGKTGAIVFSFGFKQAEYTPGETVESLVSVADKEMYRVKNTKSK